MSARVDYKAPLRFRWLTGLYDGAAEWTADASRLQAATAAAVARREPLRVLDVGCGTGGLTHALRTALPHAAITAIDPDRGSLQRTEKKLNGVGKPVTLRVAHAQQLPLADNAFEAVTSCLVFHHLMPQDKAQALAEIRRVLAPGATAVITDFDRPTSAGKRLAFGAVRLLDGRVNTAAHANGEFASILEQAGFGSVRHVAQFEVPIGTVSLWELTQ